MTWFEDKYYLELSNQYSLRRSYDINYMLKVQDAKAVDIQKALQAANIKVASITEIYKEKGEETQQATQSSA